RRDGQPAVLGLDGDRAVLVVDRDRAGLRLQHPAVGLRAGQFCGVDRGQVGPEAPGPDRLVAIAALVLDPYPGLLGWDEVQTDARTGERQGGQCPRRLFVLELPYPRLDPADSVGVFVLADHRPVLAEPEPLRRPAVHHAPPADLAPRPSPASTNRWMAAPGPRSERPCEPACPGRAR